MIILLFISIGMVVGGIVIGYRTLHEDVALILIVLGSVFVASVLLCWPVVYYSNMARVEQYHIMKSTIASMKADGLDVTDAAINQKILGANSVLAQAKYWNRTMFKRAIPDELAELPYLK